MIVHETRNELLLSLGKPKVFVEIGVFKGEFSKFIYENLIPEKLYLVDLFEGVTGSGDKDGNNMQYTNLMDEYENLKSYFATNDNVFIIKDNSLNFLKSLDDEILDIVYIDGDHEYIGVKSDLNLSYNKVKKNGYICGHDYVTPRFDGVVNAVNEFCQEKNLKITHITKDGCPTYCIKKI